jgi:transposase
MKYDFLVLYPINPQTLSKFREAFTPSRAKNDSTDAEFLVELMIHHRERLKAWTPNDEKKRTLQLLAEHRRRLVGDQTRISNRLTALLKGYFPQVLEWGFLTSERRWSATSCCAGQASSGCVECGAQL